MAYKDAQGLLNGLMGITVGDDQVSIKDKSLLAKDIDLLAEQIVLGDDEAARSLCFWIIWNLGNTSLLIPLLVLCQIFWGATASTFIPSELSMMTDLGKSRKGENFGTVHAVRGLGGIPTGLLGGLLIEYVHFLAPFIITTLGVILELWYIIRYGENLKDIEDKPIITKIEERSLLEFPYEP